MPIHGISGVPGHGKTSLMMEMLAAAIEANNKARGAGKLEQVRPLWCCGIEGLSDSLLEDVEVLADATRWNEVTEEGTCDCKNGAHQVLLKEGFRPDGSVEESKRWAEEFAVGRLHGHLIPDGSLIFVDEAWHPFGHLNDARGKPPPLHVQGLAEHRHRALDFVWTFQGPSQMYPFARPLIGPHWHTVRRYGSQLIDVYQWGEFCEDIKSQGMRDRAVKVVRTLPTKQRGLWKSASGHTITTKLPGKLFVAVALFVLAIPLLAYGFNKMRPSEMAALAKSDAPEAGLPADGASSLDGPRRSKAEPEFTAETWAARLFPRIKGMHGSQPVFDGRKVATEPRTFCTISGEPGRDECKCWTEQVTRVFDVQDAACRDWALHGRYDPFRAPLSDAPRAGAGQRPAETLPVVDQSALSPGQQPDTAEPQRAGPSDWRPGVLNPNLAPYPAAGG